MLMPNSGSSVVLNDRILSCVPYFLYKEPIQSWSGVEKDEETSSGLYANLVDGQRSYVLKACIGKSCSQCLWIEGHWW